VLILTFRSRLKFLLELSKPFFVFVIGFLMGIVKAIIRKSPISKKQEFINYHKYLFKPVVWTFIVTFVVFLLIGLGVGSNKIEVVQKSLIAGFYGMAATYVFMIWGANLIREG